MFALPLFLAVGLFTSHVVAAPAEVVRPTVTIDSGPVAGTTTVLPSATVTVNKFLGIPFAASPPVRFSPPKDAEPWSNVLDASNYRPTCLQQFTYPDIIRNSQLTVLNNPGHPPPEESEDCLYINIYAPVTPAPSSGRAVLFWIYGGDLAFGSNSLALYDGSRFATDQDIIVVVPNYRTNVFGFPNAPSLPLAESNLGFLDQRKALAWVQQNIASFGGDPSKVTIFGESSGGYSVKQLLAFPPNPQPFRAAIIESQAFVNGVPGWTTLVAATGCALAPSQVECMRNVPARTLQEIIERVPMGFPPVDDKTTHALNIAPAFDNPARVPTILGSNQQEGRLFPALFGFANASFPIPTQSIEDALGTVIPGFPNVPQEVIDGYPPPQQDGTSNPVFLLVSQIVTDFMFTCRTSVADLFFQAHGMPTWRYVYNAHYPNFNFYPNVGAYHTAEIPSVWGTYDSLPGATELQVETSRWMNKAWADFAKDPESGPGEGWPKSGTGGWKDLLQINTDGRKLISQAEFDAVCPAYAALLAVQGP